MVDAFVDSTPRTTRIPRSCHGGDHFDFLPAAENKELTLAFYHPEQAIASFSFLSAYQDGWSQVIG
jgi:hypothetical protein